MSGLNLRTLLRVCFVLCVGLASGAQAQSSRNLAPGFTDRPSNSKLVVIQPDIELFSLSAGGVQEPKADWTQAALGHFRDGLTANKDKLGAQVTDLAEKDLDDVADINALHGAVAQSVFLHHMMGGEFKLPTKNDALDWSLGEAVKPLRDKTGADYALFTWIRDSYSSADRKAAMIAMALLGVGIPGGAQLGYASLVDLRDGRVVWFNNLARGFGDLREAKPAQETVDALLKGFPAAK
jgi:hypothetical protein